MTRYAACHMPPKAPLKMRAQTFRERPAPRKAQRRRGLESALWRVAAFGPALLLTASLAYGLADWFRSGGVTALEMAVIALVSMTFIWVSLSVSTALLGLVRSAMNRSKAPRVHGPAQDIALLIPVYNEPTGQVFGNAAAMLGDLAQGPGDDRFTLFILSDTRDGAVAMQEEAALAHLRASAPEGCKVYYRRRAENTDKKVGNLTDWITGWGAAYDAMVVLDADSLMSGAAIRHLARELAADPDAGLIQSFPVLIGAESLFGRMQQFSNAVYGWLLAEGLAGWSDREGNYWGHNAIIRTRAFAGSAQLPYLRGPGGRQNLILSHDFVEAGMLRRAGWAVRFLPQATGSFEETPQTLVDYCLRDRRWCQGNLQHLRILAARGFHPVSRFHLLQGAVGFLMSPAWMALIVIWSLLGLVAAPPQSYFNAANPLYPIWPETATVSGWVYLAVIYGMLLLPKVAGALVLAFRARVRSSYGGFAPFFATTLSEVLLSVIYAPILMVQQTVAVGRALLGWSRSWGPQARGDAGHSWGTLLRFHCLETVLGTVLTAGIFAGYMSPWLAPIAASLVLAVPLSRLSGMRVAGRPHLGPLRLDSPHNLREPRIVRRARSERARMRAALVAQSIAAE